MEAGRLRRFCAAAAAAVAITWLAYAQAADCSGAGSTFVSPAMQSWTADYQKHSGQVIAYSAVGSAAGVKQVSNSAVSFGASDMPLDSETLKSNNLVQFPIAIGGVVPVVNIDGVYSGALKLTGPVVADIFMGKLASWDAPAITALNPNLHLPHQPILVVHRSDGSGTTYNFASYLSQVSESWRQSVGAGMLISWPVGIGARRNGGVGQTVKNTPGSIGYVELTYVNFFNLAVVLVQNKSGAYVEPSSSSFAAAAATVNWRSEPDFRVSLADSASPAAYPITALTFALIHTDASESPDSRAALEFFRWVLRSGQQKAMALGYAPLPKDLVDRIGDYWLDRLGVAL